MPTGSIFHDVVIETAEEAEKLVDALEQSEKQEGLSLEKFFEDQVEKECKMGGLYQKFTRILS